MDKQTKIILAIFMIALIIIGISLTIYFDNNKNEMKIINKENTNKVIPIITPENTNKMIPIIPVITPKINKPYVETEHQNATTQLPQPTTTQLPQPTTTQLPQPTTTQIPQSTTTQLPQPTATAQIPQPQQETNVWVSEHNRIRSNVGQKPVAWNQTIADGALKHAQICKFEHSQQSSRKLNDIILGENLAFGSPFDKYTDKRMMGIWESEKQYYTHPQFPGHGNGGETGHYTQIVNKNVTEIGCGCANCNNSKMCVCRYNPIQLGNENPY